MPPIKLLVSPRDTNEASQAILGGADIIDCKNPAEGSLGANFPWIISAMKNLIVSNPKNAGIRLSATLGDLPDLPGTASLAATGLASLGVDYVKAGVYGSRTPDRAKKLLDAIVKAAKLINPNIQVVAAGYADYKRANISIPPTDLIKIASSTGCNVVMVDTAIKDGKRLLDFMDKDEIMAFCNKGKAEGLLVALAGKIQENDIPLLKTMPVDIIGVRSMVMKGGDRVTGVVDEARVRMLKNSLA